jgi:uncharacterized protein YcbK (DUF882 family)
MLRRGAIAVILLCGVAWAGEPPRRRFFTEGDGTLRIRSTKNAVTFQGRYRTRRGAYIPKALRRINRVFDANYATEDARISLRLIELLSHLRKKLGGRWVTISSGYRSPRFNKALRDRGGTVAKASLHLYGMAADLRIDGVDSKAVWEHVKQHKLGGAGYYGSPWIHLDVGPARHWTQGTANVRKGLSDHNKRISLVPELDIYRGGERIRLRFVRMTAWPIGVQRRFALEREQEGEWREVRTFVPAFTRARRRKGACLELNGVAEMSGIVWKIPADLPPGRYRARASFCKSRWEAMPAEVHSYLVELSR